MYMFFGDSHSRQFVGTSYGIFSHYIFSGATIKGLINQSSVTRHDQIIRHAVSGNQRKALFMMFGSVDFDFSLIRKISIEESTDIDAFKCERAIIYARFISELLITNSTIDNIFILGPQISPLINDNFYRQTAKHINVEAGSIHRAMVKYSMTAQKRNRTIMSFNDILQERFSEMDKVTFLRIDRAMISIDNHILQEYIPDDPTEHHANPLATQKLWRPIISKFILEHTILT